MILSALAVCAGLGTIAFLVVERRTRACWSVRSVDTTMAGSPYRTVAVVRPVLDHAPPLVRVAALSGVVFGSVAVPGAVYAMATLASDGIALSLLPSIASAAAAWCTGWLLIARARVAVDAAKQSALLSTMAHVLLLLLTFLHVVAARTGCTDRASLGYIVVACVLAVAALPQAAVFRLAIARHSRAFECARGHEPPQHPLASADRQPRDNVSFASET
jgi:hypothetical protein